MPQLKSMKDRGPACHQPSPCCWITFQVDWRTIATRNAAFFRLMRFQTSLLYVLHTLCLPVIAITACPVAGPAREPVTGVADPLLCLTLPACWKQAGTSSAPLWPALSWAASWTFTPAEKTCASRTTTTSWRRPRLTTTPSEWHACLGRSVAAGHVDH